MKEIPVFARVSGSGPSTVSEIVAYAIVDDCDFELASKYRWRLQSKKKGYVIANEPNDTRKRIRLHNLILSLKEDGKTVDHIDRNKLNNVRSNLRLATNSEQSINRDFYKGGSIVFDNSNRSVKVWKWYYSDEGKRKSKRFHTKEEAELYRDGFFKNKTLEIL